MSQKTETLSDFYKKTIDIIFGFIIGQSFLSIDPLLKSFHEIFEPSNLFNFFALAFAYFFVVIGWISYHKSIKNKPHKDKSGNARYAIDLIILFLTYYLLRLSKPFEQGVTITQYGEIFIWTLPSLFVLYSFWDILKNHEYPSKTTKRGYLSIIFAVGFAGLAILYSNLLPTLSTTDFWDNKNTLDAYWLIISFGMVLGYRLWKWAVREKKIRRK